MMTALPLPAMQKLALQVEAAGFGTMWLTESGRTAYLGCAASALATTRLGVGTAVAVAFPRSPMITASTAWELADASGGRFVLGLGTQVKAHVERRYSAEYSSPGPRMEDYVRAVKAAFAAFRGEPLDHHGPFYNLDLLPPQWSPGPIDVPDPPVYVSAVKPWMCAMAGRVSDGIHVHPFHSPEYVRDSMLPHVERGLAQSGRTLDDLTLVVPIMTAVGDTDEQIATTREHARGMISFYGSTRTYSSVFEQHGHDGLSDQLHAKQRAGDIAGMTSLITDDILDHYLVSARWGDLAAALVARYRDLAPNVRVMSYTASSQWRSDPGVFERWAEVATSMRAMA